MASNVSVRVQEVCCVCFPVQIILAPAHTIRDIRYASARGHTGRGNKNIARRVVEKHDPQDYHGHAQTGEIRGQQVKTTKAQFYKSCFRPQQNSANNGENTAPAWSAIGYLGGHRVHGHDHLVVGHVLEHLQEEKKRKKKTRIRYSSFYALRLSGPSTSCLRIFFVSLLYGSIVPVLPSRRGEDKRLCVCV